MNIKTEVNPSDFEIGVIMARFQVHKLHEGHIKLIDKVCENHKKVIIFLGVSVVGNTKSNPLDFASRKAMIQELYPKVVILPQKDQRSDEKWSQNLDAEIRTPFGEAPALLYGSRDSFIPHYKGKYPVVELTTDIFYSGTEVRRQVSREILGSEDFRAGVIHATYAQRPVTYPTVDVVAYNEKGQILLGKKPNEKLYRFIGGFVDRTDTNWEMAAKREFSEETGGCEIGDLIYLASGAIKDWRYAKSESGIMTTLFIGKFMWGAITPSDDIASLHWVYPRDINIETDVMIEHRELFVKIKEHFGNVNKIIEILKNNSVSN
jgi:bifunctional NMN adenylyltransferase/nudix hydrolase